MAAKNYKTSVAIIGGGLTGLAVAAALQKAGVDYLIIEAQGELGGLARGQNEQGIMLDYGLKSIPVGEDLKQNPLLQLKNNLGLNFSIESWTDSAKTFEDKGFTDFVGFGEHKNTALVDELSYYTQSPRLLVSGGWQILINELKGLIPEDNYLTQAIITKFDVKDDVVVSATVNGGSTLSADKFIFTLSPAHLKNLLPVGAVSGKILQRIARTTPFTALSLDFATKSKTTDSKNTFIFKDTPKNEDAFYVTGYFVSNIDPLRQLPNGQTSTWMSLVDPEAMIEDENGSKIIKTMKKLIKKAFPQLIEEKSWERLLVVPDAVGHFEQMILEKNLTLPGLSNFWVCGAQTRGEHRNVAQALASAQNVVQILVGTQEASPSQDKKDSVHLKAQSVLQTDATTDLQRETTTDHSTETQSEPKIEPDFTPQV